MEMKSSVMCSIIILPPQSKFQLLCLPCFRAQSVGEQAAELDAETIEHAASLFGLFEQASPILGRAPDNRDRPACFTCATSPQAKASCSNQRWVFHGTNRHSSTSDASVHSLHLNQWAGMHTEVRCLGKSGMRPYTVRNQCLGLESLE